MSHTPRTERVALLLLYGACVLVWLAKYHPFLAAPRIIDDDARQHVYWTYRFQDPALFPDDLLTAFFSSPKIAPLGYQALYFVGAQIMDPLLFSQFLALLLLLVSVWLLFRVSRQLGSSPAGSAFAGGLFLLYFAYSTSGGLPKSFAFPLLLGCIYLLQRQAFFSTAALLGVQSLLYPPILLNTLALTGIAWWRMWRLRPGPLAWARLLAVGLGVGIGGGLLLLVYAATPQTSWGSLITPEQARTMPEFFPQGRTAFYGMTLWQTLRNDRGGIGADRLVGFVAILIVMYLICRRTRWVVPWLSLALLGTSLGLFGLAHLVLFRLHLPSRYVLYTLPVAALLMIAANSQAAGTRLAAARPCLRSGWQWFAGHPGRQWVCGGVGAAAFVVMQNWYIAPHDPLTVTVDRTALRLYGVLQTLPKDVRIAGHPLDMDNIPLFARRTVLANQELSIPYYTGYYGEVRQRLLDMLQAYYAENAQDVWRFVRQYNVQFMVVNTQHFTPQALRGALYYEPFHSLVQQRLSARPQFALMDPNVGQRIYTDGAYILVSFARSPQ